MPSNCLVFHTSGGISSSPAAFLFLIFLRTESSSWVNGPSLMANCLQIILVIGSCVTFGGFPSRFSKCCFHSFILSCWFSAFNFALAVLFLLVTFVYCLPWTPTYGRAKAGRPARTYIQQLWEDTGCSPEDLPEEMNDWDKWWDRVRDIRASGTTWWWWWWWYIYIYYIYIIK